MKASVFAVLDFFLLSCLASCILPPTTQPLHLYDLQDGTTLVVLLHPTAREHGVIYSKDTVNEQFHGEYHLSANLAPGWPYPIGGNPGKVVEGSNSGSKDDLPEDYGFGKNSEARPSGTGILVGKNGTVIEIVFYKVSSDLQTGDGVGRDNKGRHYRIYLSTE